MITFQNTEPASLVHPVIEMSPVALEGIHLVTVLIKTNRKTEIEPPWVRQKVRGTSLSVTDV